MKHISFMIKTDLFFFILIFLKSPEKSSETMEQLKMFCILTIYDLIFLIFAPKCNYTKTIALTNNMFCMGSFLVFLLSCDPFCETVKHVWHEENIPNNKERNIRNSECVSYFYF